MLKSSLACNPLFLLFDSYMLYVCARARACTHVHTFWHTRARTHGLLFNA